MKKRYTLSLIGAGLLSLGLAGVALAGHGHALGHHKLHGPEIDAASLGSGLALLVGSGLLVVERFRRRK